MHEHNTPIVAAPAPRVTVRRILTEWSFTDDQPISPDDYDRLIGQAVERIRVLR